MPDHCGCYFFFQAEDGIRDLYVTGVQTCALPISFTRSKGGGLDMRPRITALAAALLAPVFLASARGVVQTRAPRGDADWPMFRHDAAGTGHSALAQITAGNVAKLSRAWTYSLQSATPAPATGRGGAGGPNSEATPIVVNGVM